MMKLNATRLVTALAVAVGFALPVCAAPVAFEVIDKTIPKSLTMEAGDPGRGKKALLNRKQGNCLACHSSSALKDQPFHGEVGPSLDGVSGRWKEAELRMILVDSKVVFEDTIMPSFYIADGYTRIAKKFMGKTILTAQQVEDILAYLNQLK